MAAKTPKFGLCIDWETSGSTWGGDSSIAWQGLSYGAIIFDVEKFEEVESIYREIKFLPDLYGWSTEAERIHGLSVDHLADKGVESEDAAADLIELISKYIGAGEKVMILGHNVDFDISFTNQLFVRHGFEFSIERKNKELIHIPLHHVKLDTSSTGLIALGIYKSNDLFKFVGFEKRGDHNALDDARMTLASAATIRQLCQASLESLVISS